MCIEVIVKLSAFAKNHIGAERLSNVSGLSVRKKKNDLGTCLHFSVNGACSCDFLAKNQPIDEDPWTLDAAHADSLACAIALLGKEAKSFVFRARWLGEESKEPQRIKLAALQELIRTNRVARNIPYLIGKHG